MPAYPLASNLPGAMISSGAQLGGEGGPGMQRGEDATRTQLGSEDAPGALREQLRALIIEELQQLIKG